MGRHRLQSRLERGVASDLWRNTLAQIPTVFGRLVYLSSLRNQNSGRYEHFGLSQVYGEEEADRTLQRSHSEAFAEWLSYGIEQQKADLDLYLAGLNEDRRALVETWRRVMPYRLFVPASARDVERKLYLADLETILLLLFNECGAVSPDPDA